jgi:hypothetical protein
MATPLASLSSKFNFMLFGLGVVSMDSNFTFVLPMLYLRTAHVCEICPHSTTRSRSSDLLVASGPKVNCFGRKSWQRRNRKKRNMFQSRGVMPREQQMEVLERFALGDVEAFEILFREFQGEVYRCTYRIVRDAVTAEDLTVEAFWHIYRIEQAFSEGDRGESK